MKPPTKPPAPPLPPPSSRGGGYDEPQSGRSRKDVNYVPVPSASMRAKPPLPSASAPPAAPDESPAYDDDLVEELATPTRTPKNLTQAGGSNMVSPPTVPQEWQPLPTGPMQPIAPPPSMRRPTPPPGSMQAIAAPPPSQRHFTPPPGSMPMPGMPPPSQRHLTPPPNSVGPVSSGPYSAAPMHASAARVRQVTPMDTPPYSSQQQITGPQLPLPPHLHPNTGSFPRASGEVPSSQRGVPVEEGVPLGYVVASAFFLAIALVGFGLYLAFEVISL